MDTNQYQDVDNVSIRISMDIIEHFSKNLYRSSTKAIEELVTNGYDAFARNVHVFLPGHITHDTVVVWDDGDSMDVKGLKDLWHIASSPKANTDREINKEGRKRKVIGKFGIGKLASYSLGMKISHLCKKGDKFLFISINYNDLKTNLNSDQNQDSTSSGEYSQNIFELTKDQAFELITSCFKNIDDIPDNLFEKDNWTCAIIGNLKDKINFKIGILKRVLARSMPLKPDFKVFINNEEIESLLLVKNALASVDFSYVNLIDRLKTKWEKYSIESGESQELQFLKGDTPSIIFPKLGEVHGSIRVSNTTLNDGKAAKVDRMYGFFIYVRDRLINIEDDKLFLKYPSFATFYRSQIIIHCDGLDDVLLADRERFSESEGVEEFKLLQAACYEVANKIWTDETKKNDEKVEFKNRLPIHRTELFADPISFLWSKKISQSKEAFKTLKFDLADPVIERTDLGENGVISELNFESDELKLMVNDNHPFFKKQLNIAGNTKVAKEVVREIENMIVMESLFEGYLYFLELDEQRTNSILNWRQNMYQQLAIGSNKNITGAIEELRHTSYKGGRSFEIAVSNILKMIGFKSDVVGNAGNPDVVAKALIGQDSYILTFEPKGSIHGLPNTKSAVAAGPSHAKKVGAEHAVIIAREFSGFDKKDFPAVLEECNSINRNNEALRNTNNSDSGNIYLYMKEKSINPTVSIMTTENLISLALAVYKYQYDLASIKSIFTTVESPDEKALKIERLTKPEIEFDFLELLQLIYKEQTLDDGNPQAPVVQLYRQYYSKGNKGITTLNEFRQKLQVLRNVAFPYLPYSEDYVSLTTKPEIVANNIKRKLNLTKEDE